MNLATSFRKNFAAASLVAGSVLLANAGSAQAASIAPECKAAGDVRAQIRCSMDVSKKNAETYKNGKKLIDAALTSKSCYDTVTRDIVEAKKAGPLSDGQKSSFQARINTCG